jgi:soluble lytic murein transglycosylase-like protein
MKPARHLLLALAALLCAGSAWADLWGYVDERGVAHFSSRKVNDQYELFVRGDMVTDPAKRTAAAAKSDTRPVAVPTYPQRLLAFFDVSNNYKAVRHLLRQASAQHQVDYNLLKAVIATESGFDPHAVSPRGAVGLMQIMPVTAARWTGLKESAPDLRQRMLEPQTNITAGSRHLGYLLTKYKGQVDLALAAYNAGEGTVARFGNQVPDIDETRQYVQTVLLLYEVLKPPVTTAQQRQAASSATPARASMPPPLRTPLVAPMPRASAAEQALDWY